MRHRDEDSRGGRAGKVEAEGGERERTTAAQPVGEDVAHKEGARPVERAATAQSVAEHVERTTAAQPVGEAVHVAHREAARPAARAATAQPVGEHVERTTSAPSTGAHVAHKLPAQYCARLHT